MKQSSKQLIGTIICAILINLVTFSFLSYVLISMSLNKQNIEVLCFFILSAESMICWIVSRLFPKKFHHFAYKHFHKSMAKSFWIEYFLKEENKEFPDEEEAYSKFIHQLNSLLYFAYFCLAIGLFIVYMF